MRKLYQIFFSFQSLMSESATSLHNRPTWAANTTPYVSFDATVADKNSRNKSRPRSTSPGKQGSRPATARSERDPPSKILLLLLYPGKQGSRLATARSERDPPSKILLLPPLSWDSENLIHAYPAIKFLC